MKSSLKLIAILIVILILSIGGILLYQTYGLEDSQAKKDEIDISHQESAAEAAENADIFD